MNKSLILLLTFSLSCINPIQSINDYWKKKLAFAGIAAVGALGWKLSSIKMDRIKVETDKKAFEESVVQSMALQYPHMTSTMPQYQQILKNEIDKAKRRKELPAILGFFGSAIIAAFGIENFLK